MQSFYCSSNYVTNGIYLYRMYGTVYGMYGEAVMEKLVWDVWILCTLQFSICVWKVYGSYGAILSYICQLADDVKLCPVIKIQKPISGPEYRVQTQTQELKDARKQKI